MFGASLNYLVSGSQQRFRDGEAEGFGGFEVDDEFVFGGTAVRLSVEQIQLLSQCGNGRAGIALRKRLQNGDFLEGMDGQNL